MSTVIHRDDPGVTDGPVEARVARRYIDGSGALLKALGKMWPCGHLRTPETTHTIAGKAQCKRCRRQRWMRRLRIISARRGHLARVRDIQAEGRQRKFELRVIHPDNGRLPFCDMLEYVADHFELAPDEITGACRRRSHSHARSVLVKLLSERGLSGPEIGRLLGGRDHSTIFWSRDRFDVYARVDPRVSEAYTILRDRAHG